MWFGVVSAFLITIFEYLDNQYHRKYTVILQSQDLLSLKFMKYSVCMSHKHVICPSNECTCCFKQKYLVSTKPWKELYNLICKEWPIKSRVKQWRSRSKKLCLFHFVFVSRPTNTEGGKWGLNFCTKIKLVN